MPVVTRTLSLRRTVGMCVLAFWALGLPVAFWHGIVEPGSVRDALGAVLLTVFGLAGAIGATLGCCVYITQPEWWHTGWPAKR